MKKIDFILLCIVLCIAVPELWGKNELSLSILPQLLIPTESIQVNEDEQLNYNNGGGISFAGEYTFSALPFIYPLGKLDFNLLPVQDAGPPLIVFSLCGGLGLHFPISSSFSLKFTGYGGYYIGLFDTEVGGDFVLGTSGGLQIQVNPRFKLGAGICYNRLLQLNKSDEPPENLPLALWERNSIYSGIAPFLDVTFIFKPGIHKPMLKINTIHFDPVFPSMYKYYMEHPIGYIELVNNEKKDIHDLTISLFINKYMDNPHKAVVVPDIKKGETKRIFFNLYLMDEILANNEMESIPARITAEYLYDEEKITVEEVSPVRILNRNAITWDDAKKAAAFITPKDPAILSLSKHILSSLDKKQDRIETVTIFLNAMALFESLMPLGIKYVKDPTSPAIETDKGEAALDFLQFPLETLAYKAGDCDDLTVLFCTLLESVGIETALISTRGHIYPAFGLKLAPFEINKIFQTTENLIILHGETWIPVETTIIGEGFLRAWQEAARQWRSTSITGDAQFYPVHDAWDEYEPVLISSDREFTKSLLPETFAENCYKNITTFVEKEIEQKVTSLIEEKGSNMNDPYIETWTGIIYGRFGMMDYAEEKFTSIIEKQDYIPALVNLGYIYYSKNDFKKAIGFFEKAYKLDPGNPVILEALEFIMAEDKINEVIEEKFSELLEHGFKQEVNEENREQLKSDLYSENRRGHGIPFWIED